MAGWTNRGKIRILEMSLRGAYNGGALPSNLYVALVTSATAPGADINTLGDLTEIAAGNGYTSGGYQLGLNATDFDTLTEDDSADLGKILIKDVAWTASGGAIPSSGDGARYAVLTDDNGTVASREVLCYWDLSSDRSVSNGGTLTLEDLQIDIRES